MPDLCTYLIRLQYTYFITAQLAPARLWPLLGVLRGRPLEAQSLVGQPAPLPWSPHWIEAQSLVGQPAPLRPGLLTGLKLKPQSLVGLLGSLHLFPVASSPG